MERRKSLILLAGGLGASLTRCGSEWHLPGENVTLPSNISVGADRKQNDASSLLPRFRYLPTTLAGMLCPADG
jgi:hypothetical protein